MSKHTPGPWKAYDNCVFAMRDHTLYVIDKAQSEANARRIVACVNACEGISTEALKHRGHLLKAEDSTAQRLNAERAELLEALKGLLDALPSATTHPAIKAARAAIAKAEGKE